MTLGVHVSLFYREGSFRSLGALQTWAMYLKNCVLLWNCHSAPFLSLSLSVFKNDLINEAMSLIQQSLLLHKHHVIHGLFCFCEPGIKQNITVESLVIPSNIRLEWGHLPIIFIARAVFNQKRKRRWPCWEKVVEILPYK